MSLSSCFPFVVGVFVIDVIAGQFIGETPWDVIITTFPKFLATPISQESASTEGWTPLLRCGDPGSPGNVYWNSSFSDLTSLPIYNADGQIAGHIVGIEDPGRSQHEGTPWKLYTTPDNETFWGIEAVFRDPDTICTPNATKSLAFGDRLWFADGSDGSWSPVPLTQQYDVLEAGGWGKGGCKDYPFRMGVHWWRYVDTYGSCNDTYPIFVLYDNDTLHAWGVALGNTDRPDTTSIRWEHVPGYLLTDFFLDGEAPVCLAQQSRLFSSFHVYMTSSVLANTTSCVAQGFTTTSAFASTAGEITSSASSPVPSSSSADQSGLDAVSGVVWLVLVIVFALGTIVFGALFVQSRRRYQELVANDAAAFHRL